MSGYTIRLQCDQCTSPEGIVLYGTGYPSVAEAEGHYLPPDDDEGDDDDA